MKFLAILITVCILFFSAFGGTVAPALKLAAKHDCCRNMAGKVCAKQHEKQNNDCNKQGCSMMFSCSTCGFLIVESLLLQECFAPYEIKPVTPYKIGNLSAYHMVDWKPPKTC